MTASRARVWWSSFFAVMTAFSVGNQSPAGVQEKRPSTPPPLGEMVDIGGQRIHIRCTGEGSPTVLLENGTGDFSWIWTPVQSGVASFTRVCSYDRGGYAWSDPGTQPRTFAQLALELHAAMAKLHIDPPYILVGQSYGGLVVRGFFAQYPSEVVGMVLVDAVHEDQQVVYGGQPHRIREGALGRAFPAPHISLDTALVRKAREAAAPAPMKLPLDGPLGTMSARLQEMWQWADSQPLVRMAQSSELDWSPEELARMHTDRLRDRQSLGNIPLIVLARTRGGYPNGMNISADSLEHERVRLQADLALLSSNGKLVVAPNSGHNIHLEDPELVIRAIRDVFQQVHERKH